MARTASMCTRITKYLHDGPKSINAIRDHINATTHHGTSMPALSNILGKNSEFVLIAKADQGGYSTGVWALRTSSDWEVATSPTMKDRNTVMGPYGRICRGCEMLVLTPAGLYLHASCVQDEDSR